MESYDDGPSTAPLKDEDLDHAHAGPPLLAGSLSGFNVSSLLSLLNIQQQDGQLTVRNRGFLAYIYVEKGEVVDAALGRVHGLPALFQMITWSEGDFFFSTAPPAPQRSINLSLAVIQVRASLWLDRWRNVLTTIPSLGHRIGVHSSPRGDVVIKPYQWSVLTRVVAGPMSIADLAHALKEDPLAVTRICVELAEVGLCQVLPPLDEGWHESPVLVGE